MKHGPTWNEDGSTTFRLWAPSAKEVALRSAGNDLPLIAGRDGWFERTAVLQSGSRYQYLVDGQPMPDPASRFQPDGVNGPSELLQSNFRWDDSSWRGRPWEETVLYELHTGSFSLTGDYAGIEAKLDYLNDLGITAIELMPIAAFDGAHGWGYDGVYPYAPHAAYGQPDDLRHFVNAAHQKGLMVFLDVVYNHFGPSGNYLNSYAKPFFTEKHHTPWGAAIDFSQRPVRDFFIENALYWLNEFHFDGLRFDAVHAILDDSPVPILEELAARVRESITGRAVHLVLENDNNEARYLGYPKFNAQWNDDMHHVFHVLATREIGGYYVDYAQNTLERLGRCLTQGFDYQGNPSQNRKGERRGEPSAHLPLSAFVNFTQNHDQIGNRAMGDRLAALTDEKRLTMLQAILLLSPPIPLLFMGEEWGSKNPFLYFCDFQGELAEAVREGRRKEFAGFPEFQDSEKRAAIPDPNAVETFHGSQLDWETLVSVSGKTMHDCAKHLLHLRQKKLVPLLKQGIVRAYYSCHDDQRIELVWEFAQETQMRLFANFSDTPWNLPAMKGETLWGNETATLPALSCRFTLGAAHG